MYIGDPELTKDRGDPAPTLYDAAHRGRAEMRQRDLALLQRRPSRWTGLFLTPAGPICTPNTRRPASSTSWARRASIFRKLGEWGWNKDRSTERDVLYTRVAQVSCSKSKGANLVLVHLVTPDGVEHAYGPHTPEAYQGSRRKRPADRRDLEDACKSRRWPATRPCLSFPITALLPMKNSFGRMSCSKSWG